MKSFLKAVQKKDYDTVRYYASKCDLYGYVINDIKLAITLIDYYDTYWESWQRATNDPMVKKFYSDDKHPLRRSVVNNDISFVKLLLSNGCTWDKK